jgi:hypothetical protein
MAVDDRLLRRLDELLEEARRLSKCTLRRGSEEEGETEYVAEEDCLVTWGLSARNLLAQLVGRSGDYYNTFDWGLQGYGTLRGLKQAAAALQAVRDDYAAGLLGDLQLMIAAQVFGDFLDMADHLHSQGYKDAAASIAGAVLEDALRELHLKHVGEWEGESRIGKLNEGLKQAGLYGQAVWRQIQVWADIRNDAAHGHFANVDTTAVQQMIGGIRAFVEQYQG